MDLAGDDVGIGVQRTNGDPRVLRLELEVQDPVVHKYLAGFEKASRGQKALEALRVGVIAIQSAATTLDTKIVEEKFRQLEEAISDCITDFQSATKVELDGYFKAGTGSVPLSLDTFLGERGTFKQLLGEYFNADGGRALCTG